MTWIIGGIWAVVFGILAFVARELDEVPAATVVGVLLGAILLTMLVVELKNCYESTCPSGQEPQLMYGVGCICTTRPQK